MEKDCVVKKKKMDDELSRIEQANAGYESMGMEIAGLKEELAEAQAALQEASEECVDSQLQGFMDECNALKTEIEQVKYWTLENRINTTFSIHLSAGYSYAFNAWKQLIVGLFWRLFHAIILNKRVGNTNLQASLPWS